MLGSYHITIIVCQYVFAALLTHAVYGYLNIATSHTLGTAELTYCAFSDPYVQFLPWIIFPSASTGSIVCPYTESVHESVNDSHCHPIIPSNHVAFNVSIPFLTWSSTNFLYVASVRYVNVPSSFMIYGIPLLSVFILPLLSRRDCPW